MDSISLSKGWQRLSQTSFFFARGTGTTPKIPTEPRYVSQVLIRFQNCLNERGNGEVGHLQQPPSPESAIETSVERWVRSAPERCEQDSRNKYYLWAWGRTTSGRFQRKNFYKEYIFRKLNPKLNWNPDPNIFLLNPLSKQKNSFNSCYNSAFQAI